jgi:Domain of unknown function (DUF6398)
VVAVSKSNRERRAAKRRRRASQDHRPQHEPAATDPFAEVAMAVADPDPLHLLSYVSALLSAVGPRNSHPMVPHDADTATREELVAMFCDVPTPETTALLGVIAELAGDDEVLRTRIRRELATRPGVEPRWVARLPQTSAHRAVRMGHALGDGDNIFLGVRLADSYEVTAVVYIDHNLGTLVKDAFVVPESIEDMLAEYRRLTADEANMAWEDLSLADARVWLDEAIELGAITFPPLESDSWPACRPIIEWVIRGFPAGGSGYQRPQWEPAELAQLTDRFFASEWGRRLDDADHRDLLESLLWYGTDYGPGDPLRWSSVKVEILFGDWLPRKVIAPAGYLAKAPELLRAFIGFAHGVVGLPAELTDETLTTIDACAPEYLRFIGSPRPQGPAALLAMLGLDEGERAEMAGFGELPSHKGFKLDQLAREVGGRDQLDRLDATPLPDEPFEWAGIPDDVSAYVAEVLALTDRCCSELLDVEYRTASRRVLARVAAGDPAQFRRKARVETAAAAVVWIVGKANGLFRTGPGGIHIRVTDLMDHFELKGSVSQRAGTMLRAGGFSDDTYLVQLGSPDFLIAHRRQWVIRERDRFQRTVDQQNEKGVAR